MPQVEDTEMPPYPGDNTVPGVLYEHFKALRRWVDHSRDRLGETAGVVPKVSPLPPKPVFESQPIMALWSQFLLMRRFREAWDHLLRAYEHDWDDAVCLRGRAVIVQNAATLLNQVATPLEVREAQTQQEAARLQKLFDTLLRQLSLPPEPLKYDPADDYFDE